MNRRWPAVVAACAGCAGLVAPSPDAGTTLEAGARRDAGGTHDASDGSADARDGGVLSPAQIFEPGLVQWLDASNTGTIRFDNDQISLWYDARSDGGDRGHIEALNQGWGIVLQPGAVNGHAALRVGPQTGAFTSGCYNYHTTGSIPYLVAIIAAYENHIAKTGILYMETPQRPMDIVPPLQSGGNGVYLLGNTTGRSTVFAGMQPPPDGASSATDGWNDGKFHAFGLIFYPNNTVAVRTDGVEVAVARPGSWSYACTWIGGNRGFDAGLQDGLDGYVAEVVVAQPAKAAAEIAAQIALLSQYFQAKYGLPF